MRAHLGLIVDVVTGYGMVGVFHGREKIDVSPGAAPDACLVLDSPYWLVQVGEGLAAVSGTAARPASFGQPAVMCWL
jgi:hypothetical protein